jgi:hypothetical protein
VADSILDWVPFYKFIRCRRAITRKYWALRATELAFLRDLMIPNAMDVCVLLSLRRTLSFIAGVSSGYIAPRMPVHELAFLSEFSGCWEDRFGYFAIPLGLCHQKARFITRLAAFPQRPDGSHYPDDYYCGDWLRDTLTEVKQIYGLP